MIAGHAAAGLVKPPRGAQVNWRHPLAAGLVGCWVFNEGTGGPRDLTQRAVGTPVNTPAWGTSRWGPELQFTAASDQYIDVGNPPQLRITGEITLATSYRLSSTGAFHLVAKDNNTGGRAYTFGVYAADGVNFYLNGGGIFETNHVRELRAAVTGDDRLVVATYRPSQKLSIYVNGVLTAQNSGSAISAIPSATANVLFARRQYSGFTQPLDGSLRFVYIWQRCLNDREVAHVSQMPWAFLLSPGRRLVSSAPIASTGQGPLLAGARNRLVLT